MTRRANITRNALACLLAVALVATAGGAVQQLTWQGEGVPEPTPLETNVDVAAFIFPGWPATGHASQLGGEWPALFPDASVRPLLGFYNDNLPETNDWQIYWAREFGISLFVFNWYWNNGEQYISGALENGFLNAEHRAHMDFAIQWSNHPLPQVWGDETPLRFDRAAMLDVVDYWIANYFNQPNYRKIGNRPLVIIFEPQLILEQHADVADWLGTLDAMNARMAAAGLGPLYLIASDNNAALAKSAGFEGITGYSTHGIQPPCPEWMWGRGFRMPYAYMMESTHSYWETVFDAQRDVLDFILPIGTGWDDSYRYTLGNGLKFTTGFSPAAFKAMITPSVDVLRDEGLRMVIFDAYNEWTEGSYLEPTKRFGFGMLEAIADVYGAAPGPDQIYVPSVEDAIALSAFDADTWTTWWNLPLGTPLPDHIDLEMVASGQRCLGVDEEPRGDVLWEWVGTRDPAPARANVQVVDSDEGFAYIPTTSDPQLVWQIPSIPAEEITAIVTRVRVADGAVPFVDFYYRPEAEDSFAQDLRLRFTTPAPDTWGTAGLGFENFAGYPGWAGPLTHIRLDIGSIGTQVTLESVRVLGPETNAGTPDGWSVR